jgi:type IV pilus assembly protein PilV
MQNYFSYQQSRAKCQINPGVARGFSMVELLVAVFVLSIGLLGYASMLGVSLKNNQSANHRTQAVDLAYEVIDMMRANRIDAQYFVTGFLWAVPTGGRYPEVALGNWKNRLSAALPNGQGSVQLVNGLVTVQVRWTDNRLNATLPAAAQGNLVQLVSRL